MFSIGKIILLVQVMVGNWFIFSHVDVDALEFIIFRNTSDMYCIIHLIAQDSDTDVACLDHGSSFIFCVCKYQNGRNVELA